MVLMEFSPKELLDILWQAECVESKHPSVWKAWEEAEIVPKIDFKNDKISFKKAIKKLKKAQKIDKDCSKLDEFASNYRKTSRIEGLPLPKEGQSPEEYAHELEITLGEAPTLTEAKIFQTIYQGKIAQLKYETEKGRLIDRQEVEQAAFSLARQVRDHILAIPERVAGEFASITDPAEMRERLYQELITALEAIAEGNLGKSIP